tara:strand:- start:206 stop:415 length:210 start_codon:yes stop_codon:yes gene_type:complete
MGHIVKKIFRDVDSDPEYENMIIEDNDDGKIHIHVKNIRLDLTRGDFGVLKKAILEAHDKMKSYHGWEE